MDKDIFYISVFLLAISISAQLVWYFLAKVPCPGPGQMPQLLGAPCSASATVASLQEIQNVSGYIMLFGFILLPIGLFKDGLPIPGPGAKIVLGVLLVFIVGIAATFVLLIPVSAPGPAPAACGSPVKNKTVFVCVQPGASTHQSNFAWYMPDNITLVIGVNNTVQWTNQDNVEHSVTTGAPGHLTGLFDQDLAAKGSSGTTFTFTFTTPGTYTYFCTFHNWMRGTIIVLAS